MDAKPHSLVLDLINTMQKVTTSTAYLAGDHTNHTWGLTIPNLPFQWLIGGSTVLPCQRYFGISGEPKSYKSTLQVEIGNWFISNNGIHVYLDTEDKTSATMLDAMSWWNGVSDHNNRIYMRVSHTEQWQDVITEFVKKFRKLGEQAKGERIPIAIWIDSLTRATTVDEMTALMKEGHAASRGYPVQAAQITRYLDTLKLLGTTMTVGWVQHMSKVIGDTYGNQYKEKGPNAAGFACSTHLRVIKGADVRRAGNDSAPFEGPSVEGYTLYIKTSYSSVGPEGRKLPVDLLWQYVTEADVKAKPGFENMTFEGKRQVMWFDWDGALGRMLAGMRFDDKWKPALHSHEKDELDAIVNFSMATTTLIDCDELGLERASFTEFGKCLRSNPEIYKKLENFLGIKQYPDIQTADIDFSFGEEDKPKKKKV